MDEIKESEKPEEPTSGNGAVIFMIIGALIGILLGPVGMIMGAILGALLGDQVEREWMNRKKVKIQMVKEAQE